MARTLLAHGAKPDYKAPDGSTPRSFAQGRPELELMLRLYDEEGALAFEDPPGTWTEAHDEESGALANWCLCSSSFFLRNSGLPF